MTDRQVTQMQGECELWEYVFIHAGIFFFSNSESELISVFLCLCFFVLFSFWDELMCLFIFLFLYPRYLYSCFYILGIYILEMNLCVYLYSCFHILVFIFLSLLSRFMPPSRRSALADHVQRWIFQRTSSTSGGTMLPSRSVDSTR